MNGPEKRAQEALQAKVQKALQDVGCCDFRFGVGELGLVHEVQVKQQGEVSVKVLPCCIFGMTRLVTSVKENLTGLDGVDNVEVEVAWDQIGNRNPVPQSGPQALKLDLHAMARERGIRGWADTEAQSPG